MRLTVDHFLCPDQFQEFPEVDPYLHQTGFKISQRIIFEKDYLNCSLRLESIKPTQLLIFIKSHNYSVWASQVFIFLFFLELSLQLGKETCPETHGQGYKLVF